MSRSNALTGSGPEPRIVMYGPHLTCPHCQTRREYVRVATESALNIGRAWRSPFGWQAICGHCGEGFTPSI